MVVHNILVGLGDSPEDIVGFNGKEDEVVLRARAARVRQAEREERRAADDDELYRLGLARRKLLLEYSLE